MRRAGAGRDDPEQPGWQDAGFATYMQSNADDFCRTWDEALQVRLSHAGQSV